MQLYRWEKYIDEGQINIQKMSSKIQMQWEARNLALKAIDLIDSSADPADLSKADDLLYSAICKLRNQQNL